MGDRRERRQVRMRTEQSAILSQVSRIEEAPLWKEKWETSERRYQVILSRLMQLHEVYRMNKNSNKLA